MKRIKPVGLGALIAVVGFVILGRLVSSFNPFSTRTVDRPRPALIHAINDIADLRAASAQFTVIVDIEKDAKFIPSAIKGERTVLLAVGNVDAGVDLSGLSADAITVDEATDTARIVLPPVELRKPQLDLESSRVVENRRGVLDRLGSTFGGAPTGSIEAFKVAEEKLAEAAAKSDVAKTAERNVASTITSLAKGLGYTNVEISFGAAPPATTPSTEG